jgi:hypothetical protein
MSVHLCKAGRPIDNERIQKYEPMCHYMVREFLPALALFEASMDYDDLINQCKLEVFMALKNKFDPVLAMTSTINKRKLDAAGNPVPLMKNGKPVYKRKQLQYEMEPDHDARAKQIAKKLLDPEKALAQAEKSIVFGRLQNYLRRQRHKFHPDVRGCRSVSIDGILEGVNREEDHNLYVKPEQLVDAQAVSDKEVLVFTMETEGEAAAKAMFEALEPVQQRAVLDLIDNDRKDPIPTSNTEEEEAPEAQSEREG